jgi:ABC-2 type transport system ATP-binding protein
MSVTVKGISKIFGTQRAVDNISFEAQPGEVLGFLGPNGAGKTTTMKILTCFIPQSEGEAEVSGFNVKSEALQVRQSIGYLPEHNPLYKEMYVKEYLSMIAAFHKVKNIKDRVGEMIERTGLQIEQKKRIGTLSKGYRQRVGLAQAMIHDPKVLILDEPTTGLDPNQLVEIRNLIKDLGKEKTVIFSTHIMQEVQAICDRVVIINKGQIVANDPIDVLQQKVAGDCITNVSFKGNVDIKKINSLPGVSAVKHNNNYIQVNSKEEIGEALYHLSVKENWVILEMRKEVSSVEDIFKELTSMSA